MGERLGIGRRALLTAAVAATFAPGRAGACELTGTRRPLHWREEECVAAIEDLVRMLNEAPSMPKDAVEAWYADRGFSVDDELLFDGSERGEPVQFLRTYRLSDGKLDSRPIGLAELKRIRRRGKRTAFAFTLKRYSYHAADPEGCNGMFVHDQYWGEEQAGFIAAFEYNRMTSLRLFPEWFADGPGA
ncbi:MAG: hypothetical protein QOE79_2095 [Sphingomonadales bacterium]|jgi:hypothetical protein|nr:hypothetical protein [Sphingomonadales bacterium]MEA3049553.1 hypothetical protein [Sphingomonadales bacterium]